MRTILIVALLAAMSLAGCAGDASEPLSTTDTTPDEPVDDGNTTVEEPVDDANETVEETDEEVENLVPVITVTADAVNGTAPLLVNFTIEVEDDSANLTWAFLIDGNETLTGTDFPAMFNHTFDEGAWNVTIELTDGEHIVTESLDIVASMAAEPVPEPVILSGSIVLPIMQSDATICDFALTDYVDVSSAYWGWNYQAMDGWVAEWWTGADTLHETAESGIVPDGSDNVGSCPALGTATNVTDWEIVLTHPDYVG